nr:MAG TPA: hypothetical protein [Caudoviricetes sp.]
MCNNSLNKTKRSLKSLEIAKSYQRFHQEL